VQLQIASSHQHRTVLDEALERWSGPSPGLILWEIPASWLPLCVTASGAAGGNTEEEVEGGREEEGRTSTHQNRAQASLFFLPLLIMATTSGKSHALRQSSYSSP
jgi:hypothetical protein